MYAGATLQNDAVLYLMRTYLLCIERDTATDKEDLAR